MVAAPAADHAIENAKKLPKLNVGLHLVLSNGIAELPASEIPNLVNNTGEFQINKFYSGINFFFNIKARKQLKREIRAQFEAYKKQQDAKFEQLRSENADLKQKNSKNHQ